MLLRQRQRDRDGPEHAAGKLHLGDRAPPVVVAHETVERRVSPHAEHEEVGNLARRDRDFLQTLGALERLGPLLDRHEQRLERATPVRRHKLRHVALLLSSRTASARES